MFIYVSGPYSPSKNVADYEERNRQIEENVSKANEVALAILQKGHVPFVPHTMMKGWEERYGVDRETMMKISDLWVAKCDALYFIAPSPGANAEKKCAIQNNLKIFEDIEQIPPANFEQLATSLPEQAFNAYLTEYKECMESYRHTYATIWQAGALFGAISGAMVAIVGSGSMQFTPLLQVLVPLPILFWYWGIFRPMNGYGELRSDRLAEIEKILNQNISRLKMQHFLHYGEQRKKENIIKRFITFKWLWKPRVVEIVTVIGVGLLIVELIVFWKYFLAKWLGAG